MSENEKKLLERIEKLERQLLELHAKVDRFIGRS